MEKSIKKELLLDTISNYAVMLLRMGSAIFLVRIYFTTLSQEHYGLWIWMWTLMGFTIFLDLGLGVNLQKKASDIIGWKSKRKNLIRSFLLHSKHLKIPHFDEAKKAPTNTSIVKEKPYAAHQKASNSSKYPTRNHFISNPSIKRQTAYQDSLKRRCAAFKIHIFTAITYYCLTAFFITSISLFVSLYKDGKILAFTLSLEEQYTSQEPEKQGSPHQQFSFQPVKLHPRTPSSLSQDYQETGEKALFTSAYQHSQTYRNRNEKKNTNHADIVINRKLANHLLIIFAMSLFIVLPSGVFFEILKGMGYIRKRNALQIILISIQLIGTLWLLKNQSSLVSLAVFHLLSTSLLQCCAAMMCFHFLGKLASTSIPPSPVRAPHPSIAKRILLFLTSSVNPFKKDSFMRMVDRKLDRKPQLTQTPKAPLQVPSSIFSITRFPRRLKKMMRFSIYAFAVMSANAIIFRTDAILASSMLSLSALAIYQIGSRPALIYDKLVNQFQEGIAPLSAKLSMAKKKESLKKLFIIGNRIAVFLALPSFSYLFVASKPLLQLWIGIKDAESFLIAKILLIAFFIIAVFRSVSNKMLLMHNQHVFLGKVSLLEAACNLIFSIVLTNLIGLVGIAYGTLIPCFIISFFLVFPKACQTFLMSPPVVFWRIFGLPFMANLIPICIFATLFYSKNLSLNSWSSLFVSMFAYGILYLIFCWFLLKKYEKDYFFKVWKITNANIFKKISFVRKSILSN